jgi:hypothetical protein
MKFHFWFPFLCLALLAPSVFSQSLKSDAPLVQIGSVREDAGWIPAEITLRNTSSKSKKITLAKPDCGCMRLNAVPDSLQPNQLFLVSIMINPYNHPGPFLKKVRFLAEGDTTVLVVEVKGYVYPLTSGVQNYTFSSYQGNLLIERQVLFLGQVHPDTMQVLSFRFQNTSKEPIRIKHLQSDWAGIEMHGHTIIEPGDSIYTLQLKFRAKGLPWGYQVIPFTLVTDDALVPSKKMYLALTLTPHRDAYMVGQKPVADFSTRRMNLGAVKSGALAETNLVLYNRGSAPLELFTIQSSCNCMSWKPSSGKVAAGDSLILHLTLETKGSFGVFDKKVELFTNDPVNPYVLLPVKMNIE